MDKKSLANLQAALADTLTTPTVGGEARQILADHPLTDKEAAEAEKEGLTHLEYRLAQEVFLFDELYSQWSADWREAEAVVTGRKRGSKIRRAEARKTNPFTPAQVKELLVNHILTTGDSYKAVVAELVKHLNRKRSYFHGELGKKSIDAEVELRRDKV
jgi:hypothetical protein